MKQAALSSNDGYSGPLSNDGYSRELLKNIQAVFFAFGAFGSLFFFAFFGFPVGKNQSRNKYSVHSEHNTRHLQTRPGLTSLVASWHDYSPSERARGPMKQKESNKEVGQSRLSNRDYQATERFSQEDDTWWCQLMSYRTDLSHLEQNNSYETK